MEKITCAICCKTYDVSELNEYEICAECVEAENEEERASAFEARYQYQIEN